MGTTLETTVDALRSGGQQGVRYDGDLLVCGTMWHAVCQCNCTNISILL